MMTREVLVETVKKKYAAADEATISAVLQTLQEAQVDLQWQSYTPSSPPVLWKASTSQAFIGEHLALEQYRKLSTKERGALQRELKEKNRNWLNRHFADLQAAWLMVLDGKLIASGASLNDYPSTEQIREIGGRHGKRPFVFINDLLTAIEESGVAWHATVYAKDFYPTVPLVLHNAGESLELTADFDTGAASSFTNYDLLFERKIILRDEDEQADSAQHLSHAFEYVGKTVSVEVKLPSGEILNQRFPFLCVTDWEESPFVRINPRRTALAGRNLFLALQTGVHLDFANRRTTITTPQIA